MPCSHELSRPGIHLFLLFFLFNEKKLFPPTELKSGVNVELPPRLNLRGS